MKLVYFFISSFLLAQFSDNHPELDWQYFETEHFIFYFHEETERSAIEASKVAELIYGPVTDLYDFHPPAKTSVILKDVNDFSNGMAMFYDNKIEIWTKPIDFDMRGSHRWIQNVITHEFVHIVQIGAAMKFSKKIPAFYFQIIDYEDEKRDDVLYGYPNQIISSPLPGTSVPPWFAEGVAQYMYSKIDYDFWDSHRSMILRDAVLNDNLYDYHEMNLFGKKGIGNELVYNQGFAFVNYIVSEYGENILRDITDELASPFNYSIERAFKNATNDDIVLVFQDFYYFLKEAYSRFNGKSNSFVIAEEGLSNIKPSWSSDGDRLLYLSDKNHDFFNKTDLYLYDFKEKSSDKIATGVKGFPTWISDSVVVYSKINIVDKFGSKFFDLFEYNLNTEQESQLTHGKRLYSPIYDSTLNKIAAIHQYDGTSNIMIADYKDSLEFNQLTSYDNGFQMFKINWFNESIIYDGLSKHGRNIYTVDMSGLQNIKKMQLTDERDPNYNKNQNILIWSEDKDEVFNLYYTDSLGQHKLTDVTGGAFYPAISSDGKVAFSLYEEGKYKLAIIDDFKIQNKNIINANEDWESFLAEIDTKTDNIVHEFSEKSTQKYFQYSVKNLSTLIMPRLFYDYDTFKPGFYTISSDALNKLSIFSGASINKIKDLDIFLMFETYNYLHTPYIEFFWATRNKNTRYLYQNLDGEEYDNTPIENNLFFNLFSLDAGSKFRLLSKSKLMPGKHDFKINYQFNNYRQKIEQTITQYNQLNDIEFYDNYDFSFDYYRSHIFSFQYSYTKQKNHFLKHMLPNNGYSVNFKLYYELNDFLDGFGINEDYGTFGSILSQNNTWRILLDLDKNWSLSSLSFTSNTSIGYISNQEIDDFFYFFGGGMPGLKAYTYYDESLKGTRKIIQTLYIRNPLLKERNFNILSTYIQHMSLGLILQIGNVFNENNYEDFKFSRGLEMRFFGYNFYSYPMAINYEYHISDDNIDGKHYFKLLFDF